MTSEEQEVRTATLRFYDAIEQMISGKGVDAMREAWLHSPQVTSSHPTGDWSRGWEEISATWDVFAGFGKEGNGGSRVQDIQVYVYGDVAYATIVFISSPTWGGAKLNCTNILRRVDGVWKMIHHHPDKAPTMQASLEKMAEE
jgi:ketosteroid isomerase-like protein